jgi:hypothetical protein
MEDACQPVHRLQPKQGMIAALLAFAAAAAAESVPVHEGPAAGTRIVGLLRRDDVVEVLGCAPSCETRGAWAILEGGAARLRDLRRVAEGSFGPSGETRLVWGMVGAGAKVREQASAQARILSRQRAGTVLAFRNDPALLAGGWLQRSSGGFVAAGEVRLAQPSALRGEHDPRGAPSELTEADLAQLVADSKALIEDRAGVPLPQDPHLQLTGAIEAVFRSWENPRAVTYRQAHGIFLRPREACAGASAPRRKRAEVKWL